MERFAGKVALVTGAGSGIGQATALAFAREGARVAVVDLRPESAADTVAKIIALGGQALPVTADVSRADQVAAMVRQTIDAYGRLDMAVNNAGGGQGKGITDTSEEDWDFTFNLNLKGVWLSMKYEIPEMLKTGGGAIVNISSISAWRHFKGNNPCYVTSKAGVLALTKYAAVEFATRGIRVNAILPGTVKTPLAMEKVSVDLDIIGQKYHPMKRAGTPEELANAAVFLCSPEASFITGVTMPVDGGWSAK